MSPQYDVPAHCGSCGQAFPWTQAKIQAARDLADEISGLNAEERELLKKSFDDLVRDTPQTPVAAARFKRLAAKGGRTALDGFRSILTDVASETAKKLIFG